MKNIFVLLACVFLAGCATSTIEKRRTQRYAGYGSLTPEQKAAVDAGQIKVGMSTDAVYIAWGKPTQAVMSESSEGALTTWLYYDTYLQGYSYWTHGYPYDGRRHYYYEPGPRFQHDYNPVPYVQREVIFEKGVVRQWRTLPRPGY